MFIRRSIALFALVLLGLAATGPGFANAAPLELGAFYCPSTPCLTTNAGAMDAYKTQYGRYPDMAMNYRDLDQPLLYSSERTDLKARGVTPLMTVEPYVAGKAVSLSAIAGGTHDSLIHAEATAAKEFGEPLLVRFAQDMNGTSLPWGGGSAATYKEAWIHYVEIFRADKANNVKFVWSPRVNTGGSYPFTSYFPGNEYVDYLGLDGYNSGGAEWRSLSQIFSSSYGELTSLSSKPVLIAETASAETGGSKAEWIRTGLLETIPQQMPNVVGIVWFSRDLSGSGKSDWRLESSTASKQAWQDVVNSAPYGGNVTYLRPNAVRSTEKPWTVTGASAWAALDDPVTPSATPNAADYIKASGTTTYTTDVDLTTTSLIGKDVTASKVWFYTSTTSKVKVELRGPSGAIAATEPSSTGWHSLAVTLDETQAQLDGLYLRFVSLPGLSASQQVQAAFLELTTGPDDPTDLGAYYCPSTPCFATNAAAMDGYQTQYGRYPDIALNFRQLGEPLLYTSEMTDLKARGVTPMMTVEPYVESKAVTLNSIADGTYDTQIHAAATAAKKFGQPILLRFAHEMNGSWFHWGKQTPFIYKEAWIRYVNIFRGDEANNVKFVWSPNENAGGTDPFTEYFPGDAYVDYVALDGYNRGGTEWASLKQVFTSSYKQITELSAKPVLIAETGSAETGGSKASWITTGLLETVPAEFPRIVGVVWFSRDLSGSGERDWRLETSSASTQAWQEVVDSPLYGG
jgi:beta-mannanase